MAKNKLKTISDYPKVWEEYTNIVIKYVREYINIELKKEGISEKIKKDLIEILENLKRDGHLNVSYSWLQQEAAKWHKDYKNKIGGYAVCKFIEHFFDLNKGDLK